MSLWWLSYVDEERNVSRGVVIVRAGSFLDAVAQARRLELSPGGQVKGFEVPVAEEAAFLPYEGAWISTNDARKLAGGC